MADRLATLKILGAYFSEKGKIMTQMEYKAAPDKPIRFQTVRKPFGSWSRLDSMLRAGHFFVPKPEPQEVKEVDKKAAIAAKFAAATARVKNDD